MCSVHAQKHILRFTKHGLKGDQALARSSFCTYPAGVSLWLLPAP